MIQTSALIFQANSCNLSLTATLSSTRMKLRQGELRLNDNTGDPKFPTFLYDEDAMDSTFTTGLFRGPFLLAVSSDSVVTMKVNIAHGQHSGIHFHLYFSLCHDRCKGVVKARERQNPWDGEGYPLDYLLHSDSRACQPSQSPNPLDDIIFPGIHYIVLSQYMGRGMEGCQAPMPLCPSLRTVCSPRRPLVHRNSQVVERVHRSNCNIFFTLMIFKESIRRFYRDR